MSAWLDAVARVFVAPRTAVSAPAVAAVPAPSVIVCGPVAEPLACALALLVRRHGPAVMCAWGGLGHGAQLPATGAARRLAGSLAKRGLTARASGRLVTVALDPHAPVAVADVGRASAAAGDIPVAIALCGPREAAFDRLVAAQDLAVVAPGKAPEEIVRLGVEELGQIAASAVAAPALPPAAAWCARAGLGAGPAARRALGPALDALGGRR